MRIGAPKVFTRTKYFYSTPTNGGYHQEALRVRVKSQVPGIPTTQVSKLASLGSGTHVGKPGDGGGAERKPQLAHLASASAMKSFSLDPSFTL